MAITNSNSARPNDSMKWLFIFCLITFGLDRESLSSSMQMTPNELVNSVAMQTGTDEKGSKQVIHSWNRASDPTVIDKLIDACNSNDKHSSHALSLIIQELPIKTEDKARALANRLISEKETGKKVHLMRLLMKTGLGKPETLPTLALPALAKLLGNTTPCGTPTAESEGDMRICDVTFDWILTILENRNIIQHHSLPWTFEIGDGVNVEFKDKQIAALRQFLVSKGLIIEGGK